jgi:hypothetical protein
MKSYFLAPIESRSAARAALSAALPGQTDPWLLKDDDGDVIAYFSLVEADDTTGLRTVTADVSGRHHDRDVDVIAVLQRLRETTGGEITNDA